MDDFENKLTEIHDRVLNNALTEEEQNNYLCFSNIHTDSF